MSSLARLGPDQPAQPLGAAGAGDDPEQHLGLAELGVLGGEPDVGGQRQLAAAAERVAGDRGDHRLGDPRHRGHRGLHRRPSRDHVGVGQLGHLLDVVARGEDLLAAVQRRRRARRRARSPPRRLAQLGLDLEADRVHLRPVEADGADTVGHVETHELTHGPHHAVRPISRLAGCPDSGGPATRWRRSGPGTNHHLGSTWSEESTNFAVWAPEATAAYVCLVDDDGTETRHRLTERSLGIWHGARPRDRARPALRLPRGRAVGARAGAAVQPAEAAARPLRAGDQRRAGAGPGDLRLHRRRPRDARLPRLGRQGAAQRGRRRPASTGATTRRSRRRWRDTVIYELHVKGMTKLHDRVPEPLRGTYAGLATPPVVDYLRDLGVTAVELLPVHHFLTEPAVAARGLTNYWGYNSIGFFAPHAAYSSSGDRGEQVTEFKADGQGLPRRRARGDPRRGLQPHRRGRRRGSDAVVPRARRQDLPPALAPGRRPRASTTPTGT